LLTHTEPTATAHSGASTLALRHSYSRTANRSLQSSLWHCYWRTLARSLNHWRRLASLGHHLAFSPFSPTLITRSCMPLALSRSLTHPLTLAPLALPPSRHSIITRSLGHYSTLLLSFMSSLTRPRSYSLTLSHSLTLTHSHSITHSLSLTHPHSLSLTHALTPALALCLLSLSHRGNHSVAVVADTAIQHLLSPNHSQLTARNSHSRSHFKKRGHSCTRTRALTLTASAPTQKQKHAHTDRDSRTDTRTETDAHTDRDAHTESRTRARAHSHVPSHSQTRTKKERIIITHPLTQTLSPTDTHFASLTHTAVSRTRSPTHSRTHPA
jgi:hypothetical protein